MSLVRAYDMADTQHDGTVIERNFIRTAYDLGDNRFMDTVVPSDEPVLVVQSDADSCDINLIIANANRGIAPNFRERVPQYGDVSEVPDYQSALNIVIEAQDAFMALPAMTRERFNNDPAKLMDFLSNVENRSEAERLGLLKPKEQAQPVAPIMEPAAPVPAKPIVSGTGGEGA